jgi:hypothetical protein
MDVFKNGCGGTKLNTTTFNASATANPDQNLGVDLTAAGLVAGDRVVLCPSGYPATPIGNGAVTVTAQ